MAKKDWYYDYWDVVEDIPEGWRVAKLDSPMPLGVFISNGKSPLNGGELKILKLTAKNLDEVRKQQKSK